MKQYGSRSSKTFRPRAEGDGHAAAARRAQRAVRAGAAAGAVSAGRLGVVDFAQVLFEQVADRRGEFPAGVRLAVGQDRDEVERRAASVAGAAVERRLAPAPPDDVEQVVLQAQDRVALRRP